MPEPAPLRSLFVTNLAWFLVAIGGLSAAATVIEALWVGVAFALGLDPFEGPHPGARTSGPPDLSLAFYIGFVVLHAVASAATLAAGLGLLRRRNWARRLLIVVLGTCCLVTAGLMLVAMFPLAMAVVAKGQGEWLAWVVVIGISLAILLVGAGVMGVLVWMIRRLRSPEVRGEFRAA